MTQTTRILTVIEFALFVELVHMSNEARANRVHVFLLRQFGVVFDVLVVQTRVLIEKLFECFDGSRKLTQQQASVPLVIQRPLRLSSRRWLPLRIRVNAGHRRRQTGQ